MTTKPTSSGNACLLVASCDDYSDAWPPFFTLLQRYWPDCPFPIYLISNYETVNIPGVTTLALGQDQQWACNMLLALDQLPFDHILYFQEDYFLQRSVASERVLDTLQFAKATGAGFVRLAGGPDFDIPHDNSLGLGLLSPALKFRVSLQAALWHRKTLTDLLIPGETGWDMEILGTQRSRELSAPFFGVRSRRPVFDYCEYTGILKGKWVPAALRHCRQEGIEVDTSRREIHGDWPFLVKQFRNTPVIKACRKWFKRVRGRAA